MKFNCGPGASSFPALVIRAPTPSRTPRFAERLFSSSAPSASLQGRQGARDAGRRAGKEGGGGGGGAANLASDEVRRRGTSGGKDGGDNDEAGQRRASRQSLNAARWTVVLAGIGLVSFAFFPRDGQAEADSGPASSSRWSLFSGRSGAGRGSAQAQLSAVLQPYRYGKFRVLSVDHVTTPAALLLLGQDPTGGRADPTGDGQHVLLRIQAAVAEPGPARQEQEDGAAPLRVESVYLKEPSLQIERAYTPLRRPGSVHPLHSSSHIRDSFSAPGSGVRDGDGHGNVIELLIKRYADGELSRYATALRAGDIVELRGPVATWDWKRDHAARAQPPPSDVVMLVGGTGVTTAHQLLHTLLHHHQSSSERTDSTRLHILYAAPRPSSFLLLPELVRLRDQAGSAAAAGTVRLFAESLESGKDATACMRSGALAQALEALSPSHSPSAHKLEQSGSASSSTWSWRSFLPGSSSSSSQILTLPVQQGRITSDAIQAVLHPIQRDAAPASRSRPLVLISGPDGMVAALAGPKEQDGSGGQGALGGVLRALGLVGPEDVFKL
ncbi:hypothetical protein OC834_003319 [Tilletia horrida]|nr:hypothetical protein OC834_003319 [Tilletia horrida]